MAVINPDNASVFDEGEVYLLDWNYTGSVEDVIPAPGEVPGPEWLDAGLLGTEGVTYTPGLEKTFYDGWGHPRFKGKTSKGTMELSFNALEQNTVTKRIAYGKHDGYVSLPKGFKAHLLIITREDDVEEIEVTTRPALLTTGAWTKSESGVRTFPITADLFGDSEGRVLRKVDEATAGPASYVVTVPPGTTRWVLRAAAQRSDGRWHLVQRCEHRGEGGDRVDPPAWHGHHHGDRSEWRALDGRASGRWRALIADRLAHTASRPPGLVRSA
ncbi:hypothetical protein GS475_10585 [Rhodococcus hoagii]|nr:hypothetical protein [Prescottella equi]